MKKGFSISVCVCACLISIYLYAQIESVAPIIPRPELSEGIYKKLNPSVVKIILDNWSKVGSGILVGRTDLGRGVILTACHVIAIDFENTHADSLLRFHDDIKIVFATDTTDVQECEFLNYFDRKNNLALIVTKSAIPANRIIRYARSQDVDLGGVVAAMGFPDPVSDKLTGTVGKVKRIEEGYLIFDAYITFANSGGPLVDKYGRMIGLSLSNFEDYGFAVSIDTVSSIVKGWLQALPVKEQWEYQRYANLGERLVKDPLLLVLEAAGIIGLILFFLVRIRHSLKREIETQILDRERTKTSLRGRKTTKLKEIKVFVSYAKEDKEIMNRIRKMLERNRFKTWIDDEELQPGTRSWRRSIQKAIDTSHCLVVILSPDAKTSQWVEAELDYAETQNKIVFPLLARGDKATAIPFGFTASQWIDIRKNFKTQIEKLCVSIDNQLDSAGILNS